MITFYALLEEMCDVRALTYYPEHRYTSWQSSSYDRRSVRPDRPGWFANGDAGHYVAVTERDGKTGHVLLDARGPGCITRIWSANPKGILRVYIDGADTPVIEDDFAAVLEGRSRVPYPLAAVCSGGRNLYLPIPYAKSCRVEVVGSPEEIGYLYYHVNCRTYLSAVDVVSFAAEDWEALPTDPQVIAACRTLLERQTVHTAAESVAPLSSEVTLAPGERASLFNLAGPGAISEITLQAAAEDWDSALRQIVLQVGFDKTVSPQIDAPIGDFFGCGPGLAPFRAYPFEVGADGTMTCRFIMPYAEQALGFLWNRGAQPVRIKARVTSIPYRWTDASMHFRARWRVHHDVTAASSRRPPWPESYVTAYDWPYILAHGRGVCMGSTLAVWNPTPITTLSGGWWGEGDEKVYVDGEAFPSTFGTGSEDYFGYAWSRPETFSHPFVAQPRCDGPGNRGVTVNGRWHFLDRIPFERSFEFYMELLHHAPTPGFTYARVSYLYALPGLRDDHVQITDHDLRIPEATLWHVEPAPHAEGRHTVLEAEEAAWSHSGAVLTGACYSGGKARAFETEAGEEVALDLSLPAASEPVFRTLGRHKFGFFRAESQLPCHAVTRV